MGSAWGSAIHGAMGLCLPSEAISVLHGLPARSQQHRRTKGGGQAAKPRPALPGIHLPHHGHPAWGLCAPSGWEVMGILSYLPSFLGRGGGKTDSSWLLSARAPPGRGTRILKGGDTSLCFTSSPDLGDQKEVLESLELKLWMVLNHYLGAGN